MILTEVNGINEPDVGVETIRKMLAGDQRVTIRRSAQSSLIAPEQLT